MTTAQSHGGREGCGGISEPSVEGYQTPVSGNRITNTLIAREPERYAEFSGAKTWRDNDDAAGKRPDSITVQLLRDDVVVETRTATARDGWKYSFGRQPLDDGYGHVYGYKLREEGVEGYFARYDGLNVTNALRDISVKTEITAKAGRPDTLVQRISNLSEEELEGLLDMFDYGTPLYGMLGTGDETPLYPFVFGGVGLLALALLMALKKRKKA